MLFDKSLLQQVLAAYKDVFVSKQWPNEKYKWIAVKHFQDNWDIDAPDFVAMMKTSLAKTGNLLVSVNNFPAIFVPRWYIWGYPVIHEDGGGKLRWLGTKYEDSKY
jgi:5-methylcytosine-specific restriction protein B